jgi:hypothetical protein
LQFGEWLARWHNFSRSVSRHMNGEQRVRGRRTGRSALHHLPAHLQRHLRLASAAALTTLVAMRLIKTRKWRGNPATVHLVLR